MVGFILTGHGQFAPGLASSIAMVAGDQPNFVVVPFEEADAGTYGDTLRAAITELRGNTDGVVCFVDLLGGTPFNQSMMISAGMDNVEVVAGTNLPMLLETLIMRGMNEGMTVDEIISTALSVGPAGIVHKKLEPMMDDEDE